MPELPDVLTDVDNDEELLNDTDDFEPVVTVIDLVSPASACAYVGKTGATWALAEAATSKDTKSRSRRYIYSTCTLSKLGVLQMG